MKKATLSSEKNTISGRPCLNPEKARSNRLVTFVTNSELAKTEAALQGRREISLSAVVHRILSEFLKDA